MKQNLILVQKKNFNFLNFLSKKFAKRVLFAQIFEYLPHFLVQKYPYTFWIWPNFGTLHPPTQVPRYFPKVPEKLN